VSTRQNACATASEVIPIERGRTSWSHYLHLPNLARTSRDIRGLAVPRQWASDDRQSATATMSTRAISAELALAAACCHWPPTPAGDERVRTAAAQVVNWERFAGIVFRNRIHPLAQRALARAGVELPNAVAQPLASRSL